ncbi:2'-5' RNA ligase [Minicystis rosea]|nr:2'-5' RNA ligase [Minicystis rosea]
MFVAIDPAPAVRDLLRSAVERVRPLAPRARWVNVEGLHVTLAFLGEIAEESIPGIEAALRATAARHAVIEARFAGAGAFGGRRARVLWVGLAEGEGRLQDVARDLTTALAPFGYAPDRAELTPHLTLARAGDRGGDAGLAACAEALREESFGATRIESMVLYQSELSPKGAKYTALATLPFS